MDPLHHLPIPEIAPHALFRGRTALDPHALHQLQHSIATEGLRTPIEVWQLSSPRPTEAGGAHKYGLISGLRRLSACAALGHTTIPAFLRAPQSIAQALARMVTENEIRDSVTPLEKPPSS